MSSFLSILSATGRWLLRILTTLFTVALLYYLLCLILPMIKVNENALKKSSGILVYVSGDGMHSDVIVPLKNEVEDWSAFIQSGNGENSVAPGFISFAWGEKDYYLAKQDWSNMNYGVAAKALFFIGDPVMRVAYEDQYPFGRKFCRKIYLTKEQYGNLASFIKNSFEQSASAPHPVASSDARTNYYDARGTFSFFKTCNTWTNTALKTVGYKTGLWTALESGIRDQFSY